MRVAHALISQRRLYSRSDRLNQQHRVDLSNESIAAAKRKCASASITIMTMWPILFACHTAHARTTASMPSMGAHARLALNVSQTRRVSVEGTSVTVIQIDVRTAAVQVAKRVVLVHCA